MSTTDSSASAAARWSATHRRSSSVSAPHHGARSHQGSTGSPTPVSGGTAERTSGGTAERSARRAHHTVPVAQTAPSTVTAAVERRLTAAEYGRQRLSQE